MAGAVIVAVGVIPIALIGLPTAAAQSCPDVEVVFARGTTEPPGVGGIGQAFVDSLRSQAGGRSVGVYAVNYPASREFVTSTPAGRRGCRRPCSVDGGELSEHPHGARRLLPGRGCG